MMGNIQILRFWFWVGMRVSEWPNGMEKKRQIWHGLLLHLLLVARSSICGEMEPRWAFAISI